MSTTSSTSNKRTLSYNQLVGAMWLTVGGKEQGYWVDRLAARWEGSVCVKLTKLRTQPGETPESYEVAVGPDRASCQCKGFAFRKACKHTASLAKLAELGRFN